MIMLSLMAQIERNRKIVPIIIKNNNKTLISGSIQQSNERYDSKYTQESKHFEVSVSVVNGITAYCVRSAKHWQMFV